MAFTPANFKIITDSESIIKLTKRKDEEPMNYEEILKSLSSEKRKIIEDEMHSKALQLKKVKEINKTKNSLADLEKTTKNLDKLLKNKTFNAGIKPGNTAWNEIEKLAEDERVKDPKLTQENAITKVLEENPKLYEEYKKEMIDREVPDDTELDEQQNIFDEEEDELYNQTMNQAKDLQTRNQNWSIEKCFTEVLKSNKNLSNEILKQKRGL